MSNNPKDRGTIVVYHDSCHDGITAAAIIRQHHVKYCDDAVELYPARYDVPPDLERLKGKNVIICDFSWKSEPMGEIFDVVSNLLVLDHHKTAEEELSGLSKIVEDNKADWYCEIIFDMNRSGAGMVWDYLYSKSDRPALVNHVEDRDLWRFALPKTKEIHAACASYPLTIDMRDELLKRPVDELAAEGAAILRYHQLLVEEAAKYRPRREIGGVSVPCVPCQTYSLASDVGHALCQNEPFSATYVTREDGSIKVSLRSSQDGLDVSEIAKQYNGGGHRNSSGCELLVGEGFNK
jgi:oligoribonuclease NrnB/cAMP/cGMP phosphodiesterase (DHH superfamily)